MLQSISTEHNKTVVMSGWRTNALRVLTPVILSSARLGRIEAHGNGHLRIAVERGPFTIHFVTYDARTLHLRIRWKGELVISMS